MAATGKTPILLYGSTTATNTPSAGNLTNSSDGCEIAINVADKNLFFKDSTNAVNTVPIRQSSASSDGWLSSTDWSTFNGKVSSQWVTSGSNIYYTTGSVFVGHTASVTYAGGAPKIQNQSTAAGGSLVSTTRWSASAGSGGFITSHSRGATIGAYDALVANDGCGFVSFQGTDGTGFVESAQIISQVDGSVSTGIVPGRLLIKTANSSGTVTEQMRIASTGDVTVSTGNLVIGTSGKGIDFSATAGTGTSELLADYEEGTWTPTDGSSAGLSFTNTSGNCFYTKVGNIVTCIFGLTYPTTANTASAIITGLPYTSKSTTASVSSGTVSYTNSSLSFTLLVATNDVKVNLYATSGTTIKNNQMSTFSVRGSITYLV